MMVNYLRYAKNEGHLRLAALGRLGCDDASRTDLLAALAAARIACCNCSSVTLGLCGSGGAPAGAPAALPAASPPWVGLDDLSACRS